jgi:hypothetical protein
MNPIDFLIQFFKTFDEGQLFLPAGDYAVKIKTRGTPTQIWVTEQGGDVPVCGGDVNRYGVTLDSDGFVLYATVVSDTAIVDWQAILDPKS